MFEALALLAEHLALEPGDLLSEPQRHALLMWVKTMDQAGWM